MVDAEIKNGGMLLDLESFQFHPAVDQRKEAYIPDSIKIIQEHREDLVDESYTKISQVSL